MWAACCDLRRCCEPGPGTGPGDIDAAALREVEDRCIDDVGRPAARRGLQTATDGEFRRTSWHMDFIYQLEGVDPTDEKLLGALPQRRRATWTSSRAALSVHDRVRLGHTIFGDAFGYLRDRSGGLAPGCGPS